MLDLWTYDGGAVKALDDRGAVGGHLILWGDAETPDATPWRDYFTPATDLGRFIKAGAVDLIFHHDLPIIGKGRDGRPLPNPLVGRDLGEVKAKPDEVGLWVEGVLALRDEYEKHILEMVKAGKLSWSSGAVSHRVRREKQANGSHCIRKWDVVEASLTPTPGEPRAGAVALKALMDESGMPAGDRSTTSVFFPASPIESSDRTAAAPAPGFVDDCLGLASRLGLRAAGFEKLGPTKRKALEVLRDSLAALVALHGEEAETDERPADVSPADPAASPVEAEAAPEPASDPPAPESMPDDPEAVLRDADAALRRAAEVLAG